MPPDSTVTARVNELRARVTSIIADHFSAQAGPAAAPQVASCASLMRAIATPASDDIGDTAAGLTRGRKPGGIETLMRPTVGAHQTVYRPLSECYRVSDSGNVTKVPTPDRPAAPPRRRRGTPAAARKNATPEEVRPVTTEAVVPAGAVWNESIGTWVAVVALSSSAGTPEEVRPVSTEAVVPAGAVWNKSVGTWVAVAALSSSTTFPTPYPTPVCKRQIQHVCGDGGILQIRRAAVQVPPRVPMEPALQPS